MTTVLTVGVNVLWGGARCSEDLPQARSVNEDGLDTSRTSNDCTSDEVYEGRTVPNKSDPWCCTWYASNKKYFYVCLFLVVLVEIALIVVIRFRKHDHLVRRRANVEEAARHFLTTISLDISTEDRVFHDTVEFLAQDKIRKVDDPNFQQRFLVSYFGVSTSSAGKWTKTSRDVVQPAYYLNHEHECTWDGIICDNDEGNVIRVRGMIWDRWGVDWSLNMNGRFSPAIFYLPFLQELRLSGVGLHPGPLPRNLGRHLIDLDLSNNQFNETIPTTWRALFTISDVNISLNSITGPITIPGHHGGRCDLFNLDVSSNPLQGSIPPELTNCRQLLQFSASRTGLEGTIPNEFSNLTKLEILYLDHTLLHGDASPVLKLSNITDLCLRHTALYGSLEQSLSPLWRCDVAYTEFYGKVPERLCSSNHKLSVDCNLDCPCCAEFCNDAL